MFVVDEKSDKRCKYLLDMIDDKCFEDKSVFVFPPGKEITMEDVKDIPKESLVFGGRISKEVKDIEFYSFLEDETFLYKNTIPTAEGVIKLIIENTDKTFDDLKVLIVGVGRVGQMICNYLIKLDMNVFCYPTSNKETGFASAFTKGVSKHLDGFDVIINTVPVSLFAKEQLNQIDKDCFVCEVATGDNVNSAYLKSKGINVVLAHRLPGKVSPKSSAKYMKDFIMKVIEGNDK